MLQLRSNLKEVQGTRSRLGEITEWIDKEYCKLGEWGCQTIMLAQGGCQYKGAGRGLVGRDLASTYVLCPSTSPVPDSEGRQN